MSAGDDRVQINVASSSALSGMTDAAEGLDSLYWMTFIFSDSSEDLNVDVMIVRLHLQHCYHGSDDWMDGTHYAEISLGNTLSGEVHVWTQTPVL